MFTIPLYSLSFICFCAICHSSCLERCLTKLYWKVEYCQKKSITRFALGCFVFGYKHILTPSLYCFLFQASISCVVSSISSIQLLGFTHTTLITDQYSTYREAKRKRPQQNRLMINVILTVFFVVVWCIKIIFALNVVCIKLSVWHGSIFVWTTLISFITIMHHNLLSEWAKPNHEGE